MLTLCDRDRTQTWLSPPSLNCLSRLAHPFHFVDNRRRARSTTHGHTYQRRLFQSIFTLEILIVVSKLSGALIVFLCDIFISQQMAHQTTTIRVTAAVGVQFNRRVEICQRPF